MKQTKKLKDETKAYLGKWDWLQAWLGLGVLMIQSRLFHFLTFTQGYVFIGFRKERGGEREREEHQ